MSLIHSIQSQFHRLRGDSPKVHTVPLKDPQLQSWCKAQPGHSSKAAMALAGDLQQALLSQPRELDLSRHSPQLVSTLPRDCIRALRPALDHLTLPSGCEAATVLNFAEQLNLRELTAHDVQPRGAVRDRDLPSGLVVLHCDESLMPAADRASTLRVLDTVGARTAPLRPLRHTALSAPDTTQSQPKTPVTVARWNAAATQANKLMAAHQPQARLASVDAAPGLESHEAAELHGLLQAVPTELLPVRGRHAARLACEWLAEGGRSELSPEQARHLHTAITQARLAFLVPMEKGLRVSDAADQLRLHQLREWENVGATTHERRTREAGFERDLQLCHDQLKAHFQNGVKGLQPRSRPSASVPSGELARARTQLAPFLEWMKTAPMPPARMNISPLQLAPLEPLVRRAAWSPALATPDRLALLSCSYVIERVAAGKTSSLSRTEVATLADGLAVLGRLPADDTAPPLPHPRPDRNPVTV